MPRDFDDPKYHIYNGQVGGLQQQVEITSVRLNDSQTDYTAGDLWGGLFILRNVGRIEGGSGYLHAIRVTNDDSAATLNVDFILHIFREVVDLPADNVALAPSFAAMASRVCSIDSTAALFEHVIGANVTWDFHDRVISFVCAEGDRNLYAAFEVTNAHDPVELGRLHLALVAVQD